MVESRVVESMISNGERGRAMVTLTLLVFMAASTEFMPAAMLPAIARNLGVSEPLTGLLLTSFAFGVAACAVPLARATIRWNRRSLLIWAAAGYSLSNALMAFAGSFAVAAAGRAIGGICHAILLSIVPVIAARLVRPGRLGRSVAVLWIGTAMAYLAGIPVGAAFGTGSSGWRWVFLSLSVGAALLTLVARWSVPSMPSVIDKMNLTLGSRLVVAPGLLFVAAATTSVLLGTFVIYSFIVPLLISSGVAESSVSLVLLLFGSAAVGGLWWAGLIVDRRPRGGLIVALILLVGGMALFREWSIGGVALWGFAYGSLATYFNTAALRAAPESLDIASAFINAGFNLGVGGGALVGSAVLIMFGPEWLAPTAIGFVVLGLCMVIFARRNAFPVLDRRIRRSQ
jgi:predicted MFS family arabinose efflux permease